MATLQQRIKQFKLKKAKNCHLCVVTFVVCLVISVGLIVGGFFVPPMGVIDGSVLTAVGELVVFPTLAFGMRAVELGYDLKFQKGEHSVELTNGKGDDTDKCES